MLPIRVCSLKFSARVASTSRRKRDFDNPVMSFMVMLKSPAVPES
jgi:hypothetical protein